MSWNFKHNDGCKKLTVKKFDSFRAGLEWCSERLFEHGERWDGTELEAGEYVAAGGKWIQPEVGDEITYEDCPACENTGVFFGDACDCGRA